MFLDTLLLDYRVGRQETKNVSGFSIYVLAIFFLDSWVGNQETNKVFRSLEFEFSATLLLDARKQDTGSQQGVSGWPPQDYKNLSA